MKKSSKSQNLTTGFTLIEMIVSIALFSFVMVASTTVILSVIDANHKAQGLKITINNLSLAIENMARHLRTGKDYQVDGVKGNCSDPGVDGIRFTDQYGNDTRYRLNSGAVDVFGGFGGMTDWFPITSADILIDRLCFYISGTGFGDTIQPRVLMTVGGVVSVSTAIGAKEKTTSRFDIQTFVSQRLPDVPL
jgi:prepilin-type N-terminal cleavage/methylation domain-containing protein